MRANTKKFKVLEAIGRSPTGLSFTEIQRVACELNGHDFDERCTRREFVRYDPVARRSIFAERTARRWRGFWCTNLVYAGKGILPEHCVKVNGRWMLTPRTVHQMGQALHDQFCRQVHKSALQPYGE